MCLIKTDFAAFIFWLSDRRLFACTTKATQYYDKPCYRDENVFLFRPESRGLLPTHILNMFTADGKMYPNADKKS